MEVKTKIKNGIKLTSKTFVEEKKTRQPSEWEKLFANYATNKAFISKIYKNS